MRERKATSDDYGTVNLYRWPCVAPGAPAKTFMGHGPRVAMVRFTPKSDFLASAGETDRCLFQWSRKRNVGPETASLDDEAAAALAASLAPVGLAPPPDATVGRAGLVSFAPRRARCHCRLPRCPRRLAEMQPPARLWRRCCTRWRCLPRRKRHVLTLYL